MRCHRFFIGALVLLAGCGIVAEKPYRYVPGYAGEVAASINSRARIDGPEYGVFSKSPSTVMEARLVRIEDAYVQPGYASMRKGLSPETQHQLVPGWRRLTLEVTVLNASKDVPIAFQVESGSRYQIKVAKASAQGQAKPAYVVWIEDEQGHIVVRQQMTLRATVYGVPVHE